MKNLLALLLYQCLLGAAAAAAALPTDLEARIARIERGLLPASVAPGQPLQPMGLQARMAALKVPGVSIAVINGGRLEWARGFGYADLASGRRMDSDTLMQAASISKAVTAMGALVLVERGALQLDGDVNAQLRGWQLPDNAFTAQRKVSLRDLLSHMGGVSGHGFTGYPAGAPLPTLTDILDGKPPANSAPVRVDAMPGSAWKYSGGGFTIVQMMMSEASGLPFAALMQKTVLDKLGMANSSYDLPAAWAPRTATAYLANGEPVPGRWHRYPEMAAASLWTTPSDLARFVIELQRGHAGSGPQVLSPAMARQMLSPGLEAFGLGLFLGEPDAAQASFRHSGGNTGIRTMLFAYVRGGQGAIVMTNSDNGAALYDEILRAIAAEYGWTDYRVAVQAAPGAP